MIIAIDFDGTYDRDPPMWDAFIVLARSLGHTVYCVTCRQETLENMQACDVPGALTYCTSGTAKDWYMKQKGINVSVWIEDDPRSIIAGK